MDLEVLQIRAPLLLFSLGSKFEESLFLRAWINQRFIEALSSAGRLAQRPSTQLAAPESLRCFPYPLDPDHAARDILIVSLASVSDI